jgi:nitrogen fixation/metabolism regulation signal transduction histidine kinase
MTNPLRNPVITFGLLTVIIALVYAGFELNWNKNQATPDGSNAAIERSLDIAEALFNDIHDDFVSQSIQLKERLENRLNDNFTRQAATAEFSSSDFWGINLFRNNSLYAWQGFALTPPPQHRLSLTDSLYVTVYQRRNVVFLFGQITFEIGDNDSFDLYTTRRIEQKNVLPIALEQEVDLANTIQLKNEYPVRFSFLTSRPSQLQSYRKLSTLNADSVGVVYSSIEDLDLYLSRYESEIHKSRTVFQGVLFLMLIILFFMWTTAMNNKYRFLYQLAGFAICWILISGSDLPYRWIPHFLSDEQDHFKSTYRELSMYAIHSIFLFLVSIALSRHLILFASNQKKNRPILTLIIAFCYGILQTFFILFYILYTRDVIISSNLLLIELSIFPGIETLLFYLFSGFFLLSVSTILIAIGWYLLSIEDDKTTVLGVFALFGFLITLFTVNIFTDAALILSWIFPLSVFMFAILIFAAFYIYHYPQHFAQTSGFRLLLAGTLFAAICGYTIIANSHQTNLDAQLFSAATQFSTEEDVEAREVTRSVLAGIEQRLLFYTQEDITERRSAFEGQFNRAVLASIRDEWRRFSFDIQLLLPNGTQIADYSTGLDTPPDILNMEMIRTAYNQERIRRETNRPVVQARSVTANDNYSTFYRGWIPVYDEITTNRIIAWIYCSVYIERPDFNKPIRAVLAASTLDDWKSSYYLSEYVNGLMTQNTVKGIYKGQPEYTRLPDRELQIAYSDSIAYITNITTQGVFREVLINTRENTVVKASTPIPGFDNHLFSFFRFNILLILSGLILFPLLSLSGVESFKLFRQNRKFRHRLLDGLVLVTILFLVVLILATQFTINKQNERNLQREIVTKLDNLAESIRFEQLQSTAGNTGVFSLSRLTSPLNVDAIFYENLLVSESTTPQIFQQNLLPRIIPYDVFDFLYLRQRKHLITTINIGDQTLLIGYRALLNDQNQTIGAIAIPTFVHSPIYTEQMLETTSYMLAMYLLIFGIFIIGAVIISNRLTKPLQFIQAGLNKISGGDLNTTIPVSSRDEIGLLSESYNEMVGKLKKVQSELALAEREAAWKEMAQQVAHEIKNPLTPMKLNIQHLQRQLENRTESPEELRRQIDKISVNIIEQIESLNKIASDFSKFAKPVQGDFKEVELTKLLESVALLYEHDEKIKIRTEILSDHLIIKGAPEELTRTIINLVKNGLEAMDNEGEITLKLKRIGKQAVIEVSDKGKGIEPELNDRIFVPNFSTKSSGTGLGLAISKKIIEAHNGEITFTSKPGKGSTFRIHLPLL